METTRQQASGGRARTGNTGQDKICRGRGTDRQESGKAHNAYSVWTTECRQLAKKKNEVVWSPGRRPQGPRLPAATAGRWEEGWLLDGSTRKDGRWKRARKHHPPPVPYSGSSHWDLVTWSCGEFPLSHPPSQNLGAAGWHFTARPAPRTGKASAYPTSITPRSRQVTRSCKEGTEYVRSMLHINLPVYYSAHTWLYFKIMYRWVLGDRPDWSTGLLFCRSAALCLIFMHEDDDSLAWLACASMYSAL